MFAHPTPVNSTLDSAVSSPHDHHRDMTVHIIPASPLQSVPNVSNAPSSPKRTASSAQRVSGSRMQPARRPAQSSPAQVKSKETKQGTASGSNSKTSNSRVLDPNSRVAKAPRKTGPTIAEASQAQRDLKEKNRIDQVNGSTGALEDHARKLRGLQTDNPRFLSLGSQFSKMLGRTLLTLCHLCATKDTDEELCNLTDKLTLKYELMYFLYTFLTNQKSLAYDLTVLRDQLREICYIWGWEEKELEDRRLKTLGSAQKKKPRTAPPQGWTNTNTHYADIEMDYSPLFSGFAYHQQYICIDRDSDHLLSGVEYQNYEGRATPFLGNRY